MWALPLHWEFHFTLFSPLQDAVWDIATTEGWDLASPVWPIWAAESLLESRELPWLEKFSNSLVTVCTVRSPCLNVCWVTQLPLIYCLPCSLCQSLSPGASGFPTCIHPPVLCTIRSETPSESWCADKVSLPPDLPLQDSNQQKPEAGNYGIATAVLPVACR